MQQQQNSNIPTAEAYFRYVEEVSFLGLNPLSHNKFGVVINKLFNIKSRQVRSGKTKHQAYVGLEWTIPVTNTFNFDSIPANIPH